MHHVSPRNYLNRRGVARSRYHQIANYVVMQGEINIAVGDRPPTECFQTLWRQCAYGVTPYRGTARAGELRTNPKNHCIPQGMDGAGIEGYGGFLKERRVLLAARIRDY